MRIVVVGGPRCGKSTLARWYRERGTPTFCGDPLSKVKEPEPGVTYLPEGLDFSGDKGAAQWIVDNWFSMRGPWLCEGHVMARALRRCVNRPTPCDKVLLLPVPKVDQTPGQLAMTKGVMKVWGEIARHYGPVTEVRVG